MACYDWAGGTIVYYPKGFDRNRAIMLAELVRQVYSQFEAFSNNKAWQLQGESTLVAELKLATKPAPVKSFAANFEKEHRQTKSKSHRDDGLPIGFIARRKSEAYLVFRGTMTTKEWIRDFNIHLKPYPYTQAGKVHDGFIQVYDVLRKSVHDAFGSIGYGKRLFVAGHSLGAALATLAALDLASTKRFKDLSVYTFGSPRVGNRLFATEFNRTLKQRSFRIANTCDLVVSMPFPVPFLGFLGGYFTHVETPIDFTIQKEDGEKNHDLGTYLEALQINAGRNGLIRTLFK